MEQAWNTTGRTFGLGDTGDGAQMPASHGGIAATFPEVFIFTPVAALSPATWLRTQHFESSPLRLRCLLDTTCVLPGQCLVPSFLVRS